MGRPSSLIPDQRQEAAKALATGTATQADLARQFSVNRSTISRLAEKAASTPRPAPAKPALDAATERAVRAFLKQLEGKYPVIESILYGSRARGDHKPDSDADLAVILEGARGDRYAVSGDFAGIEFHVLMETSIMVQGFPVREDELKRPDTFANPALIANIRGSPGELYRRNSKRGCVTGDTAIRFSPSHSTSTRFAGAGLPPWRFIARRRLSR